MILGNCIMWSVFSVVVYSILVHQMDYVSANNTNGCGSAEQCLKCGPTGCIKCTNMIVYPSRKCVDSCPQGFTIKWSTKTGYMGRICEPKGHFMGLSNDVLTILTGILAGMLFCVIVIASAVAYVKHRRKNMQQSTETSSDLDDTPERKDFIKQIEILRPYAHTFLGMLNDTRRQLRELHQQGDITAAAAYRPVVRDLAKLLILLNKPKQELVVPDDWEHLYNWAEKTLKRFKRMSEISQPQVAQLINFLQGPVVPSLESEPEVNTRIGTTMSTFKPDQHFGSNLSLQDVAVKNFNANYESTFTPALNPQWKFDYSLVSLSVPQNSEFDAIGWKNSKEYLNNSSSYFMDDGFCQLGFRPQDEITTEL